MRTTTKSFAVAAVASLSLFTAACGSDDSTDAATDEVVGVVTSSAHGLLSMLTDKTGSGSLLAQLLGDAPVWGQPNPFTDATSAAHPSNHLTQPDPLSLWSFRSASGHCDFDL